MDNALVSKAVEMYEGGGTFSEVGRFLGVTHTVAKRILLDNGITLRKRKRRFPKEVREEMAERYRGGESSEKIAKIYRTSPNTVLYILREEGCRIRKRNELVFYYDGYTIDTTAFKEVDSEISAYLYGWLVADGCLSHGNRLSLQLSAVDEEIVVLLKEYLGTSNKILKRSRKDRRTGGVHHSASIEVSNTHVANNLKHWGFASNKTGNEIIPRTLSSCNNFWRGVFEGDGHISLGDAYSLILCGGENMVNSFAEYCTKVGADGNYTFWRDRNSSAEYVSINTTKNSKKVLDALYENSKFRLTRKYKTYLERYCGVHM